jgi:hypothetical protein
VKLGDVLEPMQFDSRIFSHILVVDQVLYEWTLAEKRQFLQNCSHWIVPGGYIVLHLVDPGKYNTVVPAIQEKEKEKEKIEKRKTKQTNETKKETNDSDFFDSSIEFDTFSYSSSYEFPDEFSSVIVHTETFVDRSSQHVRANERVLHLSPVGDILKLAEQVGFHLQAKWVMPFDPHQYVFLLGL